MLDNNPEKRPTAKLLLKLIETDLALDFEDKSKLKVAKSSKSDTLKESEYSQLRIKNGNSVELKKTSAKFQKENTKKTRLRFFSEDLNSIPTYEFKMKNFIENTWNKMYIN